MNKKERLQDIKARFERGEYTLNDGKELMEEFDKFRWAPIKEAGEILDGKNRKDGD